jgi:hypothetical protein
MKIGSNGYQINMMPAQHWYLHLLLMWLVRTFIYQLVMERKKYKMMHKKVQEQKLNSNLGDKKYEEVIVNMVLATTTRSKGI